MQEAVGNFTGGRKFGPAWDLGLTVEKRWVMVNKGVRLFNMYNVQLYIIIYIYLYILYIIILYNTVYILQ